MDYPKVPKRIILDGDRATAMTHIGEAESLLNLCRNMAALGGIQQYRMNRVLNDGTLVSVMTLPGGQSKAIINSPVGRPEPVEEIKESTLQVIYYRMQYRDARDDILSPTFLNGGVVKNHVFENGDSTEYYPAEGNDARAFFMHWHLHTMDPQYNDGYEWIYCSCVCFHSWLPEDGLLKMEGDINEYMLMLLRHSDEFDDIAQLAYNPNDQMYYLMFFWGNEKQRDWMRWDYGDIRVFDRVYSGSYIFSYYHAISVVVDSMTAFAPTNTQKIEGKTYRYNSRWYSAYSGIGGGESDGRRYVGAEGMPSQNIADMCIKSGRIYTRVDNYYRHEIDFKRTYEPEEEYICYSPNECTRAYTDIEPDLSGVANGEGSVNVPYVIYSETSPVMMEYLGVTVRRYKFGELDEESGNIWDRWGSIAVSMKGSLVWEASGEGEIIFRSDGSGDGTVNIPDEYLLSVSTGGVQGYSIEWVVSGNGQLYFYDAAWDERKWKLVDDAHAGVGFSKGLNTFWFRPYQINGSEILFGVPDRMSFAY